MCCRLPIAAPAIVPDDAFSLPSKVGACLVLQSADPIYGEMLSSTTDRCTEEPQ